ncbi:MAG: hypothetical protein KKH22_00750, partial [Proteobacteria bacterium]|nr:hypothetical protein [Pseudomonadota bacterium]
MKNIRKFFRPMLVALTIVAIVGATAFLVLNRANAGSQNTPQGIDGYNVGISGDVQVDLKNVQTHASDVQAELCIEMPTLDPWNPYATLTVDGTVIPNSEVALLNAKDPKVMQAANRCYLFTFPLSTESSISGKGMLKLEKLWLELGRGAWSDAVIAEIKTRLSQVAPGVDFEVVSVSGEGGGGGRINITLKPENMSDDEAVRLILQLSKDEIPTNWQTEIDLK